MDANPETGVCGIGGASHSHWKRKPQRQHIIIIINLAFHLRNQNRREEGKRMTTTVVVSRRKK